MTMNNNKPNTISLKEFKKKFSARQNQQIREELKYYDLLTELRGAREKLGLTQDELAQKASVNRTTLSKVETGMQNVTVGTLMKLAQAMSLSIKISFK